MCVLFFVVVSLWEKKLADFLFHVVVHGLGCRTEPDFLAFFFFLLLFMLTLAKATSFFTKNSTGVCDDLCRGQRSILIPERLCWGRKWSRGKFLTAVRNVSAGLFPLFPSVAVNKPSAHDSIVLEGVMFVYLFVYLCMFLRHTHRSSRNFLGSVDNSPGVFSSLTSFLTHL